MTMREQTLRAESVVPLGITGFYSEFQIIVYLPVLQLHCFGSLPLLSVLFLSQRAAGGGGDQKQ